jgi:hypothetical protein
MGMSKRAFVMAAVAAMVAVGALAQGGPVPKPPREVVLEYCRLDADGALTSSEGWPAISPLFVWPDAPGWDSFVVIRSYKVGKVKVTGRFASVPVTYEEVGLLDSTPRFQPSCHSGGACKVTTTVVFHLLLSSKHWVMDKEGNPDHEDGSGPAVWKINAPQNGPHVSYQRALKMADDFLADASDAEAKNKAERTIEALKKAGE